jgi:hypothetical protein
VEEFLSSNSTAQLQAQLMLLALQQIVRYIEPIGMDKLTCRLKNRAELGDGLQQTTPPAAAATTTKQSVEIQPPGDECKLYTIN